MTRRRLLLIILQGAFAFPTMAQTYLCPPAPKGALTYHLSAMHSQIKVGDKVLVQLVVKNVSEQRAPLWVENAADQGGVRYQFEVRESHGNLAPEGHFSLALRGVNDPKFFTSEIPLRGSGGCVQLQPGESRAYTMDVGRLYEMMIPGTYSIVAVNQEDAAHIVPISNPVTVTVVAQ